MALFRVVLKELKKIHLKNATAITPSRNYDPVSQDNPQNITSAVSCKNNFFSTELLYTVSPRRRK